VPFAFNFGFKPGAEVSVIAFPGVEKLSLHLFSANAPLIMIWLGIPCVRFASAGETIERALVQRQCKPTGIAMTAGRNFIQVAQLAGFFDKLETGAKVTAV
jgi:hypothetical protein